MANILLADDEVNVASELAEILEEEKHSVDCAESAFQALKLVAQKASSYIYINPCS